ncbi:MAG: zinc-dependent peptidase [Acidimicrobiia bacterium]
MRRWRRRLTAGAIDDAAAADASIRAVVAQRLAAWVHLDAAERDRLVEITIELVRTTRWEAARNFELTDEMVLTIAAHAALPVLELGADRYREVSTIIVHPRTIVLTGTQPGPVPGTMSDDPEHLLGQAHYRGPVLLAWAAVLRQAMRPARGEDVVIHEFAHRLDMLDGLVDGTPPLEDGDAHRRWVEVCTAEFEQLRTGEPDPLLRRYAAIDPGEFFAVVSETFFTRPTELEAAKPDLYDVLRGFYRQDPAARERRSQARIAPEQPLER